MPASMKYAIVIIDGAADDKIASLGNKSPLEAARLPMLHAMVKAGALGRVQTVPEGYDPGSDVAIMTLLGNNAAEYYSGRSPIEAAAQGIDLSDNEMAFRCNLVTLENVFMKDHSAGNISQEEAAELMKALGQELNNQDFTFYSGVSYRNLLVSKLPFSGNTTPPHDILDQNWADYLPKGPGSDVLQELIVKSQVFLASHPINQKRLEKGLNPANSIWFWGEGKRPRLPAFKERFGLSGAVITAVDLVKGLGKLMGWDYLPVEGATGFVHTNYQGKGARALEALKQYDIVCVHVEAPDEAGHAGNAEEKKWALEQIDQHVLLPLWKAYENKDLNLRLLVLPDHPTPCAIRTHVQRPVPFVIAGEGISTNGFGVFTEDEADKSDYFVKQGHRLIEELLK
ncbi:MAG: cofactor-independent phosphoglycerate mutase [Spirochaetales bacterium]|nr:cofactor-independent phosphoglycerate mutase [Spirochaetales bacterium]